MSMGGGGFGCCQFWRPLAPPDAALIPPPLPLRVIALNFNESSSASSFKIAVQSYSSSFVTTQGSKIFHFKMVSDAIILLLSQQCLIITMINRYYWCQTYIS